jgi:hypothetical protein
MKILTISVFIGLLALTLASGSVVAQKTASVPKTVTDYFMLMTADMLPALEGVKNRRSLIKVEDVNNGYLRLEGGWEGWAEVALFRKKNGTVVIVIEHVGCGPACMGGASFFEYRGGKWIDVDDGVMPELMNEDILAAYNRIKTRGDEPHTLDELPYTYWILPRRGTSLRIAIGDESPSNGKVLMTYDWNGERFVKRARATGGNAR